jgi:protein kinase
MEKYELIKKLGEGSFGIVTKARNTITNEIVAIKILKIKTDSWDDCLNMREIKSLRKLVHRNIIKMKELVRLKEKIHIVFEFCEANLYEEL